MRYATLLLVPLLSCHGASACVPKTVAKYGYGICAPKQWYAQVSEERGTIFLCNEKKGRCSESRGGHPLPGKAFVGIVTKDGGRNGRAPGNLKDWISEVVRGSEPTNITEIRLSGTKAEDLSVTEVKKFQKSSLDPGTGTWTHYYFTRLHGRALLVSLTFMESDKKTEYYRQVVIDIIKTLWARPLP